MGNPGRHPCGDRPAARPPPAAQATVSCPSRTVLRLGLLMPQHVRAPQSVFHRAVEAARRAARRLGLGAGRPPALTFDAPGAPPPAFEAHARVVAATLHAVWRHHGVRVAPVHVRFEERAPEPAGGWALAGPARAGTRSRSWAPLGSWLPGGRGRSPVATFYWRTIHETAYADGAPVEQLLLVAAAQAAMEHVLAPDYPRGPAYDPGREHREAAAWRGAFDLLRGFYPTHPVDMLARYLWDGVLLEPPAASTYDLGELSALYRQEQLLHAALRHDAEFQALVHEAFGPRPRPAGPGIS